MKFIAKVKCRYNKVIYNRGEELRHVVGEVTELNPPPDYFLRLEDNELSPIEEEKQEITKEELNRENVKRQLTEMGIPFVKQWGFAKLQETLINAKRGAL